MPLGSNTVVGGPNFQQIPNSNALLLSETYFVTGTPAATNLCFFVAPIALQIVGVSAVFSAAAGGTSTLTVTKDTGTTAPGAGTSVTAAAFNLNATANTPQNAALASSAATTALAVGDRLSVNYANTIQSTAGLVITVVMFPA